MTRPSHPPTLLTLALRALREECRVSRGDVLLCACSGGADSSALLDVLATLRKRVSHEVVAHGVDHGLRPEAAAELDLARRIAERHGISFETTRVSVEPGSNLQERARRARYDALEAAARRAGACAIATGHTADDRAETVVMRLLRGSGPRGLAVLPPRAEPASGVARVRPLVRARRSDVLAHVRRHGLTVASDPSNEDRRFVRVRVRLEVLPLLAELSPRIVDHLCALADELADHDGAHGASEALRGLGRAQRRAIDRARMLGRRAVRLRLTGGRDVDVEIGQ
jgi:tRNA(Ile)-lysidine synthase